MHRLARHYEVRHRAHTNAAASRVAMHAVRETLLERQATATGVPLIKVHIPYPCPNETYEAAMAGAMAQAKRDKIAAVAVGDRLLEDVRR
jgi:diphthamide synthase (EF-2-diphthine--ammonia ligase)